MGLLESLMAQGRNDFVEISFDAEQGCFVAVLLVDDDDELDEDDESDFDADIHSFTELVSASGQTLVEALLQLELTYRNVVGHVD